MKKFLAFSMVCLTIGLVLTGCSKTNLTGAQTKMQDNGAGALMDDGSPREGGMPPDGGIPPDNGNTPADGGSGVTAGGGNGGAPISQ